MKTVNFSTILAEAAQLCGLDRANLQLQDFRMIRDFASSRLALAWDRHDWPEARRVVRAVPNLRVTEMRLEETTEKGDVLALPIPLGIYYVISFRLSSPVPTSFKTGDKVIVSGIPAPNEALNGEHTIFGPSNATTSSDYAAVAIYASTESGAGMLDGNVTFDTPTANLRASTDGDKLYFDGAAFTDPVEQLVDIYSNDPETSARPTEVTYRLSSGGGAAELPLVAPSPLWVEYVAQPSGLFGEPFATPSSYSVGSQVYYDTSTGSGSLNSASTAIPAGNFYECIKATTAGVMPTNADNWKRIDIPRIFARYLPRAIMADYLRSEQQFEQSQFAEADAESMLELEAHKLYSTQRQSPKIKLATY